MAFPNPLKAYVLRCRRWEMIFMMNYDIKYRLGRGAGDMEED